MRQKSNKIIHMKKLFFSLVLTVSFLGGLKSFGQTSNDDRSLLIPYAEEANRLDFQSDPDSVEKAYILHCKVLMLDNAYVSSYRSKISIEYNRGNYTAAMNSAISFITSLPYFGDAWVYLGFVQTKLNDRTGAANSFSRALIVYEARQKEVKGKNSKDQLQFQINLIHSFLGENRSTYSANTKTKTGKKITFAISIDDAKTVDQYVNKFMTNNGVQFF